MIKETNFDPIFDAQFAFRVLLDAFSHPGEVYTFDHYPLTLPSNFYNTNAVIALSLFDNNISFHSQNSYDPSIEQYIQLNTNAKVETLALADYVFLDGSEDISHLINECKTGELTYPEKNATLIISVDHLSSISDETFDCEFILSGPGIKEQNSIFTKGLAIQNMHAIQLVNTEFPLGIDIILTDAVGHICSIPRSSRFQIIQNN